MTHNPHKKKNQPIDNQWVGFIAFNICDVVAVANGVITFLSKFAEIKKVRIFATTFGIRAARLIRKHKKGIQPPNTECLFFVI